MRRLDAASVVVEPDGETAEKAIAFNARYGGLSASDVIALSVEELFPGRLALVSSFGAESVVLLHLLAEIDPHVPVLFVDTGRLFPETIEYRAMITDRLGLRDVRTIQPAEERLAALDPVKALVDDQSGPLLPHPQGGAPRRALSPASMPGSPVASASSRMRARRWRCSRPTVTASRSTRWPIGPRRICLPMRRSTICRRIRWWRRAIRRSAASRAPTACSPGEDSRAGRWRGSDKDECGIHFGLESDGSGI